MDTNTVVTPLITNWMPITAVIRPMIFDTMRCRRRAGMAARADKKKGSGSLPLPFDSGLEVTIIAASAAERPPSAPRKAGRASGKRAAGLRHAAPRGGRGWGDDAVSDVVGHAGGFHGRSAGNPERQG